MRVILPLLLLVGFIFPASAETPPKPPKKQISQDYLDKRVQQEKSQKQDLKDRLAEAARNMETTKGKLVGIAASIQNKEKELDNIELKTAKLEEESTQLQEKLKEDRLAISKLVMALERIRRVPPQALIARPETPLKTAQSAMVLSDIIPVLNNKAKNLRRDLERRENISLELAQQKEKAVQNMASLKEEQKEMESLLDNRESLHKKLSIDYKAQQIEVQKISRQSRNLKELVSRIDENQRRKKTRDSVRKAVLTSPSVTMPKPGSPRLPISGIIKTRYHDLDKFGAKSKGIRIEGRSNAVVVAPMSGIIRFAGPFKNYDNMVIIEHQDGYHSLVGGLSKVHGLVGQSIQAGEPLGKLKSTINGNKPALYYELRYKGRTVNPAKKFTDLG